MFEMNVQCWLLPQKQLNVDFVQNPKLESTSFSMICNIPQLLQMHKDVRSPYIPDLNLVFIIMWLYTSLTITKTVTTGNKSGVGSPHLIVNTKRWFIRVCRTSKVIKS